MSDSLPPPWTVAHQAPLSMGILQAIIPEWVSLPSFRGSSQPRYQTQVSYIADRCFLLPEPPGKPKIAIFMVIRIRRWTFAEVEGIIQLIRPPWWLRR